MRLPTATYRLQFRPGFGFAEARRILPYLHALGISDIYASPVLRARPGSAHGYDAVDPQQLNPELGSEEEFFALLGAVRARGMGWIQDVVPNHMVFASENALLMDVLENGPGSRFYNFFDVNWSHPYESIRWRILVPFLGEFYGRCLEKGEIRLAYGADGFRVTYHDLQLPLKIESYATILTRDLASLERRLSAQHPDYIKLLGVLYVLKSLPAVEASAERAQQVRFVKAMLWELYSANPQIRDWIDEALGAFNGAAGRPESFSALDQLLGEQHFRLCYWKVANEEINYRRFFSINDLICVRAEDKEVFEILHALPLAWLRDGLIDGLRIDHIDGLYDPTGYLRELRDRAPDAFLVVEKILAFDERLPADWPIQGSTGYDFLNILNGLFCAAENGERFDRIYARFIGRELSYPELVSEKKRLIIGSHMAGDIDGLAHLLKRLSSRDRHGSDITLYGLRRALVEVLTFFPVYRSYVSAERCREEDRNALAAALRLAKESRPGLRHELEFIGRFLLLDFPEHLAPEEKEEWVRFVMRFQQFTGPLMAKGFEDTTLYVYNRFLSLNEVGGSPDRFGVSLEEFHRFNRERARSWPATLNATSTHDTKRGEDVRARLNALSEIPGEWQRALDAFRALNRAAKRSLRGREVPDLNDEYFFYQTLLGAWPVDGPDGDFAARVKPYMIKAVREAKVHTEWIQPDLAYEAAFGAFIEAVLAPAEGNRFLQALAPLARKLAFYGALNSLAQVVCKIAAPGIPDFYQGSELWELVFVDPDNRRPVDFARRQRLLEELDRRERSEGLLSLARSLLESWEDGVVKLFVVSRALRFRRERAELFQNGAYEPVESTGRRRRHVCAFLRRRHRGGALAAVPRLPASLVAAGRQPLGEEIWQDTLLLLPRGSPTQWSNLFTGEVLTAAAFRKSAALPLGELFRSFPVALLESVSAD